MSRVLLVSFSGGKPAVYRALNFECEDVLLDLHPGAVRYKAPAHEGQPPPPQRNRLTRLLQRLRGPTAAEPPFGTEGEIDLLVVDCMTFFDLRYVPGLMSLLRQAKQSVCYVTEAWSWLIAREVSTELRQFDAIASGCAGSVQAIAEASGRPTFYCPPALDAPVWCLHEPMPERVIDVYLFGRKHMPWHEALREQSRDEQIFYNFDTVHGSQPISMSDHRAKFRELNWRSKINIVNIAKINHTHERGTDEEIGFRFFEATAAGCALVGYRPESRHWDELFGWKDSIFDVPLDDPAQLKRVVRSLLDDEERLHEISIRNRVEFIRRHDAVYRWEQVFRELGLEPTPAMLERKCQLAHHADELMKRLPAPVAQTPSQLEVGFRPGSA